jgi:hypothetical protein
MISTACFAKEGELTFIYYGCSRLWLLIMAPIITHAVLSSRSIVQENLINVDNFKILEGCSDQYTRVDRVAISNDLTDAESRLAILLKFLVAVWAIVIFEFIMVNGTYLYHLHL